MNGDARRPFHFAHAIPAHGVRNGGNYATLRQLIPHRFTAAGSRDRYVSLTPMEWDPDCLARSPLFEPLRAVAPARSAGWPTPAAMQRALDARAARNARGMPLSIVPPGPRRGEKYEARIFLDGALPVRPWDWHDYFNVLVWLAFPRAKAALNERHHAELGRQRAAGERNRGPAQDALTLFDEGGVIVAASDDALLGLLRDWRWKELFWERRAELAARMRFFVFGHALYEKALRPFLGITGRGILLEVEPGLMAAPLAEQVAEIDARAASWIADRERLKSTRELAVVPVLGVPGWHPDNNVETFYDNTDYFRPARSRKGVSSE